MPLVTKPTKRSEFIPIILIVISVFAAFYFYYNFPDRVATHWNIRGEPDGWSSRTFAAFSMPLFAAVFYVLFLVIPNIDPKKERYEQFLKPYHIFKNFIIAFMVFMHFLIGANGLGYTVDISSFVPLGVGILFLMIGNYMGKIKMNWFMGIRTPWTLSSEEVWNKTHRLGGKLFILGGILMAFTGFVPEDLRMPIFILILVIIVPTTMIYSYILYAKEKKNK